MVDNSLLDYVSLKRRMIKRLNDVYVYSGEAIDMFEHFLVEEKSKVTEKCSIKVREWKKEVVEMEKLNNIIEEKQCKKNGVQECEAVRCWKCERREIAFLTLVICLLVANFIYFK